MSMFYKSNDDFLKPGFILKGKWNGKEYTIKRLLGFGENGIVYLVESAKKQYALKMSKEAIQLSYEIHAIQRLNQTQGLSLGFSVLDIDDFLDQGHLYAFYVMPYQTGVTLEHYLYGRGDEEFKSMFIKIIKKINDFHQEGFIFGDLKPEHILITSKSGQVSFIDFGGVTAIGEGVRQFTELYDRGSWKSGTRKADPHYDLFSIAVLFIQLGVGKHKLLRFFNESRSLDNLYDIIPKVPTITFISSSLKGILSGKLTSADEVLEECKKERQPIQNNRKESAYWIDWTFAASFIMFLLIFIQFIIHW